MIDKRRLVQIEATLDSANRKKDRSVTLRFTTNFEVTNEDFARMDTFVNHAGWLLFSENEQSMMDIPEQSAADKLAGKSPSQRLYNVMFVAWNELTDKSTPFEYWRLTQMESLINQYKAKLPERG